MTKQYWDAATDTEIAEIEKAKMANSYNKPTWEEWIASGFADFFEDKSESSYYAGMMLGPVRQ